MLKILQTLLKRIETAAYFLAVWSFLVLFFEPVIGYYMNYGRVETYTALANLILLGLTIINRVLFGEPPGLQRIVVFDLIMLAMGMLLLIYQAKFVIFFLLIRQTYFILQFLLVRFSEGRLSKWLAGNPPLSLMLSFAMVILLGTILLMMPVSSNSNQVTPLVDALFTSTSATCVTGLVVVETGEHFSIFGQLIILLLIQIGGLGIMTISTFFAMLIGQNINLKLKNVMTQMVGGSQNVNIFTLLKNIVGATLIIEAIGAVILFVPFIRDYSPLKAIYMAVFHSVSAFCNAGFSPIKGNLAPYVDSVIVNLTIPLLIFLGGIGFTVLADLNRFIFYKDQIRKLTLHSKLAIITSLLLVVIGFVSYFVFEYHYSMEGFSLSRRVLGSFFQSVTPRTAGFNTIGIELLSMPTTLITIILMFIGASPGSTGGGIKTTTFSLLVLSIVSLLKGRRDMSIFKRRVSLGNFREATGLTVLSAIIVFVVVILLMLSEPQRFDKIIFEAMSAFGTVGLSMGITPFLTSWGKVLITILMYIGRIGPLTLIYALAIRKKHKDINYAEETISIG